MKRNLVSTAALVAALVAFPAAAQDNDGDIVVEGERIDRGDTNDQVRDITVREGNVGDPLARFQRPVCPGVWGLMPENAQLVIDRIYDNAERAGLEVDESENCAANVWVIFVDDPRQVFEQLRDDNDILVRNLSYYERNRVQEQEGPALVWNLTSTRNREGQLISTGNVRPDEIAVNPVTLMTRSNSAVRVDIDFSVVLIERSALAGRDAYAIADYATMRALARTEEPDRDGAFPSVLTLFEDGEDRLTDFDLAYLQDLYSSRATQPGRQGLGRVALLMERAREED